MIRMSHAQGRAVVENEELASALDSREEATSLREQQDLDCARPKQDPAHTLAVGPVADIGT
jgi:hypothetical protein